MILVREILLVDTMIEITLADLLLMLTEKETMSPDREAVAETEAMVAGLTLKIIAAMIIAQVLTRVDMSPSITVQEEEILYHLIEKIHPQDLMVVEIDQATEIEMIARRVEADKEVVMSQETISVEVEMTAVISREEITLLEIEKISEVDTVEVIEETLEEATEAAIEVTSEVAIVEVIEVISEVASEVETEETSEVASEVIEEDSEEAEAASEEAVEVATSMMI